MSLIRANCIECGDVELSSSDVVVRLCKDNDEATFGFICAGCGNPTVKPAEPRIVELLVTCGCRLVTWSIPAEMKEVHVGDPINPDDLLDFRALLESDGWMDELGGTSDEP